MHLRRLRIIACSGFVLSGLLNMSECSRWIFWPYWGTLGWYISLFKVIGSVGFLNGSIMGLSILTERFGPVVSSIHCLWGE